MQNGNSLLPILEIHKERDEAMISGAFLMQSLAVFYVLVAIVFAYEGNYAKCAYWIGASIITTSVLVMK